MSLQRILLTIFLKTPKNPGPDLIWQPSTFKEVEIMASQDIMLSENCVANQGQIILMTSVILWYLVSNSIQIYYFIVKKISKQVFQARFLGFFVAFEFSKLYQFLGLQKLLFQFIFAQNYQVCLSVSHIKFFCCCNCKYQ